MRDSAAIRHFLTLRMMRKRNCGRCPGNGVVVCGSVALCGDCFLEVFLSQATGRDDLYGELRTLPPEVAEHVFRIVLRDVSSRWRKPD